MVKNATLFVYLLCAEAIRCSTQRELMVHKRTGSSLVQVMACPLFGAKPLPVPMLTFANLWWNWLFHLRNKSTTWLKIHSERSTLVLKFHTISANIVNSQPYRIYSVLIVKHALVYVPGNVSTFPIDLFWFSWLGHECIFGHFGRK